MAAVHSDRVEVAALDQVDARRVVGEELAGQLVEGAIGRSRWAVGYDSVDEGR